jgi:hypothetical protein
VDEKEKGWRVHEILADRIDKIEGRQKILCERSKGVKKFFENKYTFWAVTITVTGLLAWGVWVTTTLYAKDTKEASSAQVVKQLCDDMGEIKTTIKEMKKDTDSQRVIDNNNQQEVYKMFLQIQRDIQKVNGRK